MPRIQSARKRMIGTNRRNDAHANDRHRGGEGDTSQSDILPVLVSLRNGMAHPPEGANLQGTGGRQHAFYMEIT